MFRLFINIFITITSHPQSGSDKYRTQLHNEELEEKKKALDGCVIAAERQLQLIEEKKQGLISQKRKFRERYKNLLRPY